MFSLITSELFQLTHRYRYQLAVEVMTDMQSIKEIIKRAILGIPKGIKKMQFLFLLALTFLSEMKILFPRNVKQKTD